jgi:hypothetical protein
MTPPEDEKAGAPESERELELLPGWSSLVILLAIFVLLSAITMMAILRSEEVHVTQDAGGTRAYGPADFPEIDFDEPLLPAVLAAAESEEPGVFNVPPAPFSEEGIFPCSECHADLEINYERREMEYMHEDIQLSHGPAERWCFDCHNAEDRDRLRLVNGTLVGFDESYRLCGQCHGTIYRDWREGIHGRRRGYWDGAKSYLLCAHCHDPHHPRFEALEPLPPPVRPQFLSSDVAEGGHSEEVHTQ